MLKAVDAIKHVTQQPQLMSYLNVKTGRVYVGTMSLPVMTLSDTWQQNIVMATTWHRDQLIEAVGGDAAAVDIASLS